MGHKRLLWLKLLVVIVVGVILFQGLKDKDHLNETIDVFITNWSNSSNSALILIALTLMLFNWLLESYKWKLLVSKIQSYSLIQAIKSVLLGIFAGMATPARLGEYGGRLFNVSKTNRVEAVRFHLISGMLQTLLIVCVGLFGAIYYYSLYNDRSSSFVLYCGILIIILIIFLVGLLLNKDKVFTKITSILPEKWKIRIEENFVRVKISMLEYVKLSWYSILRYSIFSVQYYLCLQYFGIDLSAPVMFSGIATIFLVQTGIPLPPFLSMIARGEIAIVVWSSYSENVISILSATFALWFINILIPGIIGAILWVMNKNAS